MKFIHISDIHLTVPGERMAGLDSHKRLAQALNDVNANHADASRIIITGDLAHWGEVQAYEALKQLVAEQSIPVRLLIGNHDDRGTFLSVFDDHPRDKNGYVNYAENIGDCRYIYLDTTAPQTHAGHFGEDRAGWLNKELSSCARARLFMHHNAMELGQPADDLMALNAPDRDRFSSILNRHKTKIAYMHFGHVHASTHGTYCGIPFASVPSTGNQSIPDLEETRFLQGAPMAPSYYVILANGHDTIIHQIPFTWDGPVYRTGTNWEDWAKPEAAE